MSDTAAPARQHFLYQLFAPRPTMATDPTAWTAEERAIAEKHFAYFNVAEEAGTMVLVGLSLDGIGPAVAVLETASMEAARDFMARDPFITSGLMRGTVHPFRLAFLRPQPAAPAE